MLKKDPEFAAELLAILTEATSDNGRAATWFHPATTPPSTAAANASDETRFARIKQLMEANPDKWFTIRELFEITKLSRGSVGNVIYKGRRGAFESRTQSGSNRLKEFRLRKIS